MDVHEQPLVRVSATRCRARFLLIDFLLLDFIRHGSNTQVRSCVCTHRLTIYLRTL